MKNLSYPFRGLPLHSELSGVTMIRCSGAPPRSSLLGDATTPSHWEGGH